MEDLELIEDAFGKRVELLDKDFIAKLRDPQGKSVTELEKNYRATLKEEIEEYDKRFNDFLIKNKQTKEDFLDPKRMLPEKEEEKDEKALDMSKPFVARHLEMKRSEDEINKMKKQIKSFRSYVDRRNFFHKHVPGFLVINYFRMKIFWKRFRLDFSEMIFRTQTGTKRDFTELVDKLSEFFKKTFAYAKDKNSKLIKWFKEKILRKKTEEGEEEKSEDAKIAEKLLKEK